jgi:hypothetical protein
LNQFFAKQKQLDDQSPNTIFDVTGLRGSEAYTHGILHVKKFKKDVGKFFGLVKQEDIQAMTLLVEQFIFAQ